MSNLIVHCLNDQSINGPLLIGLATVIFSSPILLSASNYLLYFYQRKARYPNYVAVFLSNDQVYFGTLAKLTRDDLRLEHIYYIGLDEYNEFSEDPENPEKAATMVKLGRELHAPADHMLINRQHILFIESIGEEGQVMKAIRSDTSGAKDAERTEAG